MINQLYTIGFTKKKAEYFFELLNRNEIDMILDIRLNNTSQLAAFAKYPDIKFFLKQLNNIDYVHDIKFSPDENTLKRYKKKDITWDGYVLEFNETMELRDINTHIEDNYLKDIKICLLCSEATAEQCHRRLVANKFKELNHSLEIVHL